MGIKIAHVEAGLRSFDRNMPEEINRIVTDSITDYYFTPSEDADNNLVKEGVNKNQIFLVGNIMIDSMVKFMHKIEVSNHGIDLNSYILCTLHRPSNVDNKETLTQLLAVLKEISETIDIVFPMHPRTKKRLIEEGYNLKDQSKIHFIDPLGYFEFIKLQKEASIIITDSGGIQEESTFLGVPCLTLRENTERPITISQGTNQLIGSDYEKLKTAVRKLLNKKVEKLSPPKFWDGNTAKRIVNYLSECNYLGE
jgi:UDP-N-acetylglucosamine 2-epimerase (non-hydrolysing)